MKSVSLYIYGGLVALLLTITAGAAQAAIDITLTGDAAQEARELLRASPYIQDGASRETIYVIGSPDCGLCKQFYKTSQALKPQYEFRWILTVPGNKALVENKYFGIYEDRKPLDLRRIYRDRQQVPVQNPELVKPHAERARYTESRLLTLAGKTSFNYPLLVVETNNGLRLLDGHNDFQSPRRIEATLFPNRQEERPSLLQNMVNSNMEGNDVPQVRTAQEQNPAWNEWLLESPALCGEDSTGIGAPCVKTYYPSPEPSSPRAMERRDNAWTRLP